jgi:S-formylglutathione hydrolase
VPDARLHAGTLDAGPAGPVGYRVVTPPGWAGARSVTEPLPVLLVLHGAGSSADVLDAGPYAAAWASGALPPVIVGCASTPTEGGFYLDWPGGPAWETLVADVFPAHLADRFGADPARLAVTGASMGGYGALKIAFAQPGRCAAVAALAPAVFPGETAAAGPRHTLGALAGLAAAIRQAGGPGGGQEHVVTRLRARAAAIRASGLAIYLDCGDDDAFRLQDGTEYLHRVLWDLDISHEYRLLRGADHVGPEYPARQQAALEFIGRALAGPPPVAPAGAELNDMVHDMLAAGRQAADAVDPDAGRRYGRLPGPSRDAAQTGQDMEE